MQAPIPAVFMRGGTSRGLYFDKADLPADRAAWDAILLAAFGSPDPRQIDGVGGTTSVTSKAAVVSPSARGDSDVDYFFAQVAVDRPAVDYGPTCGNMLAGVGPYAIEAGMAAARDGETRVRIHQVNTGGLVEAVVPTPGGRVAYEGDAEIDGVPGTGAPILLDFTRVEGSRTGELFPTGARREAVGGVDATLVDAAMPVMILRAADLGKTGRESAAELDADGALRARLERLRREAGRRMGLGDVSGQVVPKIILAAPPRRGGSIASRYFVPDKTHETHAITGGIALAYAAASEGTVANPLARPLVPEDGRAPFAIEHPAGELRLSLALRDGAGGPAVAAAGIVRTARMIMRGSVMIPERLLPPDGLRRAADSARLRP